MAPAHILRRVVFALFNDCVRLAPLQQGTTFRETTLPYSEAYLSQLRLLLEEICCDLCRFIHQSREQLSPEKIQIDREFYLGVPGTFADIRVLAPGHQPYFVEVNYGYSNTALLQSLRRKYGAKRASLQQASKVVLVVDSENRHDWEALEHELARSLDDSLTLEVWSERRLLALLHELLGMDVAALNEADLLDIRLAVDRAKGFYAFGGPSLAEYVNDPLRAKLLWEFGFWRLRQLREAGRSTSREILPPDLYRGVAVVIADLCSFSSYVRDTRDDDVIRQCLTAFYSKARYQILNNGGMLYQFVGDEVAGLFGIPERQSDSIERALNTAKALLHIGSSISNRWQRQIDRVQDAVGMHVGMAIGDLQIVELRPFSRTHMGAVGDALNVASRLMLTAGPGEIVVSNAFYHELSEGSQSLFQETDPIEPRNIGRIKAWKFGLKDGDPPSPTTVEIRSRLEESFRHRVTLLYRSLQITPPYHSVEKAILTLRDRLLSLPEPELRATADDPASLNRLFTQIFADSGLAKKNRGIIIKLLADRPDLLAPECRPFAETFKAPP